MSMADHAGAETARLREHHAHGSDLLESNKTIERHRILSPCCAVVHPSDDAFCVRPDKPIGGLVRSLVIRSRIMPRNFQLRYPYMANCVT
jgi:hypothetical protein